VRYLQACYFTCNVKWVTPKLSHSFLKQIYNHYRSFINFGPWRSLENWRTDVLCMSGSKGSDLFRSASHLLFLCLYKQLSSSKTHRPESNITVWMSHCDVEGEGGGGGECKFTHTHTHTHTQTSQDFIEMVHKRPAPRFMAARFEPSPLLCRASAFRIRRCCHVCVIAEVMNQFSLSVSVWTFSQQNWAD
jgi:hypothetical protein